MRVLDEIKKEAAQAQDKYGDFTSSHEGLGVLIEEFDELKSAIHANDLAAIEIEAIQVSAVALRIALSCWSSLEFRARSVGAE